MTEASTKMAEMRNEYKILSGKLEAQYSLENKGIHGVIIFDTDLKEMGYWNLDCINLSQ
jgi:hypothetical protein